MCVYPRHVCAHNRYQTVGVPQGKIFIINPQSEITSEKGVRIFHPDNVTKVKEEMAKAKHAGSGAATTAAAAAVMSAATAAAGCASVRLFFCVTFITFTFTFCPASLSAPCRVGGALQWWRPPQQARARAAPTAAARLAAAATPP
jgi:hypothetical protein